MMLKFYKINYLISIKDYTAKGLFFSNSFFIKYLFNFLFLLKGSYLLKSKKAFFFNLIQRGRKRFKHKITVLRSPHVNKKSREQFHSVSFEKELSFYLFIPQRIFWPLDLLINGVSTTALERFSMNLNHSIEKKTFESFRFKKKRYIL